MIHPPFCPNVECPCHVDPLSSDAHSLPVGRWYKRNGTYPTLVRGSVIRFKCLVCGRGFSEQTFSLDYYVKRTIDYRVVSKLVCACVSVRALSRLIGCSCDSITNRTSRLARQCISAQSRMVDATPLGEDQCADGFQSFSVSQYFPNNIHVLVGAQSELVSFADCVTLRRSGRMSPTQRHMREAFDVLHRPDPQALTRSFGDLLEHLFVRFDAGEHRPLVLNTDCKQEYARALEGHTGLTEAGAAGEFHHKTITSRATRDQHNPLAPVNYIDREFRKDLAEHVRETVRFARNLNHSMERLWIYLHDHNVHKRFRINDPVDVDRTHADLAGTQRATVAHATRLLYTRRRFLSFEQLEPARLRVWKRSHETPLKGIVKRALRLIKRQACRGPVDLEQVREQLGVERLIRQVKQYLPQYALM